MKSTYFDQNYIKDYDIMPDLEKKAVFLDAIKDFYDKKINIYQLSKVGEFIWSSMKDKNVELADIAMTASELEYYLHAQNEGGLGNVTGKSLDDIGAYFLRNTEGR